MRKLFESWGFAAAIFGFGMILRAVPIFKFDFPMNDGGMFYSMTEQLMENGLRIPDLIKYNNLNLPFAYPPLGFYLIAGLNLATGWNLLSLFRFIPVLWTGIIMVSVYRLAREFSDHKLKSATVLMIYALTPAAYISIQAGGGAIRGLGLVTALLGIIYLIKFTKTNKTGHKFLSGFFGGLCLLSHMEMGLFFVISAGIFTYFFKVKLKDFIHVGLISAIISSPWWVIILVRHGWGPFNAAWNSNLAVGGSWIKFLIVNFSKLNGLDFTGIMFLVGGIYLLSIKKFMLPIWFVLTVMIFRRGADVLAMIPAALAGGEAITVALKSIKALNFNKVSQAALAGWMVIILMGSVTSTLAFRESWQEAVSKPDRKAFLWVKNNTKAGEKFLLVTKIQSFGWAGNGVAEWFPALTGRESITTVQGAEWKTGEPLRRYKYTQLIFECLDRDFGCINNLHDPENGLDFDYLYLTEHETCPKQGCLNIQTYGNFSVAGFAPVYSEDGVRVWKKILPEIR